MTNHPIAEQDSLEARLRAKNCQHWPSEPCRKSCLRNPDGPEAADTLCQMRDALVVARDYVALEALSGNLRTVERSLAALKQVDTALTITKIEKE